MSSARRTPEEIRSILAEKAPAGLVVSEHTDTEHWYRYVPFDVVLPSVTTIAGMLQAPHLKRWAATIALDYLEERSHLMPSGIIPADLRTAAILAHQDVFEDAGDIGTQGHGVIEDYLKEWLSTGVRPEDITKFITGEDHRLWAITRSAQKFFKKYHVIPIASELKVAWVPKKNPKAGFAGTLDALMMVAFPTREPQLKPTPGMPAHVCDPQMAGGNWWKLECMECGAKWQYYFTLVDFKTSNSILGKNEYLMQTSAYRQAIKQMIGFAPQRILILRLDKHQEKYELLEVLKPARAFAAFQHIKNVYDFEKLPDQAKGASVERNELISLDDI